MSGIENTTIDSTINLQVQRRVEKTFIHTSPPFPVDQSCSYSEETLTRTILPALLQEVTKDEGAVDGLVLEIDVALRKAAMDTLAAKNDWHRYVMKRIPSYQQFMSTRQICTSNVMASIEKDVSTGLHYLWANDSL
jgi:hypothetical protein